MHYLTDGAVPRPLPSGILVHSVFESAPNVGVTAFDVRRAATAEQAGTAYLEIVNFADGGQNVHVIITPRATRAILDRHVQVHAGEALRQLVPLSRGGDSRLRVHVDAPQNALAVDDDAFAWIEHATPVAVTVVGQQTGWLRPLFAGDPDVRATFIDPSKYELPPQAGSNAVSTSEDLIVFDRWAPAVQPRRPRYLRRPAAGSVAGVRGRSYAAGVGRKRRKAATVGDGRDPSCRPGCGSAHVEDRARRAPYGAALTPVALSAQGTPLVYVADTKERRFVVLTFGPAESNLASAPGFPVLMGNAIDWLVRPEAHGARTTGLATFGTTIARLIGPGNRNIPLFRIDGASLAMLRDAGALHRGNSGSKEHVCGERGRSPGIQPGANHAEPE